ncbi:MAG: xanthine dehydrogenase family protein molybdopterin-binding subunit [Acidimicrobiia bacterium]
MAGSILGNRVLRKEDASILTVGGDYLADRTLEGAAHVVYVRSTMAHARVTSVDVTQAKAAPGVVGVYTGADVPLPEIPGTMPNYPAEMTRPWLAKDVVRFAYEAVAAVVAETRAQAVDAAELVEVDYEPLKVVVDPEEAARDETVLFPAAGTNTVLDMPLPDEVAGDGFFTDCEVVVRQRMNNQRLASCPLEVQSAAAFWEGDRMICWCNTQTPHTARDALAGLYGTGPENVRVITPDLGGGFGSKFGSYPEAMLLPWLSQQIGRPVRWTETRTEAMMGLGHGRAQLQDVEIGGNRDGEIKAYRLTALQDTGAYPMIGAALVGFTGLMSNAVYKVPKIAFGGRSVLTNTAPIVAYRGAGRPEATAAFERAVDLFAAEIGMDPADVRRKNLIPADAFPYTTATGAVYDSGQYAHCLDEALSAVGYSELRKEQEERRANDDPVQLGIGLSSYVEITSPLPGGEFGEVEITADGKAKVMSGSMFFGTGLRTAFSMVVADRLGMEVDDVDVIFGDTDQVKAGVGTFGSRSLQIGGSALAVASDAVLEQAKEAAATLLEAAPADIVVEDGRFSVAGTPAVSKSWSEVASAAGPGALRADHHYQEEGPSFPFGTHVAVVELDTETGDTRLRQFVGVDDAGTIVNPVLLEGQVHGGYAQGIAQALYEEFRYDQDGNPLTSNFADYGIPAASELISYHYSPSETPSPRNILGAKGIGESGTIGSTPAVWNAVNDALAHCGVRHLDMPASPQKVWEAISQAR